MWWLLIGFLDVSLSTPPLADRCAMLLAILHAEYDASVGPERACLFDGWKMRGRIPVHATWGEDREVLGQAERCRDTRFDVLPWEKHRPGHGAVWLELVRSSSEQLSHTEPLKGGATKSSGAWHVEIARTKLRGDQAKKSHALYCDFLEDI
jgi:hypothetical protein